MSSPLETCEGGEPLKDSNEESIDFVAKLRAALQQQQLLYIATIVEQVEEETLSDLLDYSRENLRELLDEIHQSSDNNHNIKVSHRNKFAKAVVAIGDEKREKAATSSVAPAAASVPSYTEIPGAPTSSGPKLLFLGKEEEAAIDSIQSGHQFMEKEMKKMNEIAVHLKDHRETLKSKVHDLCQKLKQRIDQKEEQMVSLIDSIHRHYASELAERQNITEQCAATVFKVSYL